MKNETFRRSLLHQLKENIVAIISIIIALTALYDAWRNGNAEKNRNIRAASFEMIKNLGELQLAVNYRHYEPDNPTGNLIAAWGRVALIGDLSRLLPPPVPETTDHMLVVWKANASKIESDETATDQISQEIDHTRQAVLNILSTLN